MASETNTTSNSWPPKSYTALGRSFGTWMRFQHYPVSMSVPCSIPALVNPIGNCIIYCYWITHPRNTARTIVRAGALIATRYNKTQMGAGCPCTGVGQGRVVPLRVIHLHTCGGDKQIRKKNCQNLASFFFKMCFCGCYHCFLPRMGMKIQYLLCNNALVLNRSETKPTIWFK